MDVGGRPLIERVLQPLLASERVERVFVVTRPGRADLRRLLASVRVEVVELPGETEDMRETVVQGARVLETRGDLSDDDALLVCPADVLGITPDVVNALIVASEHAPRALCVPTTGGRRGHPLLFPWVLREVLYSIPAGRGLNWLLNGEHVIVREVAVNAPGQRDVDTPRDLR